MKPAVTDVRVTGCSVTFHVQEESGGGTGHTVQCSTSEEARELEYVLKGWWVVKSARLVPPGHGDTIVSYILPMEEGLPRWVRCPGEVAAMVLLGLILKRAEK